MKSLVVLKIFLLVAAATASPLTKNAESILPLSELGVNVDVDDPSHRWALIPDGDGRMHLIDTNPYQADLEPFWNADNDVVILLFTQRNPGGERLYFDAGQIRNTQFNAGAPCRFIIHGWNNDHNSEVNTLITSAYLSRGDFNVIVIGWGVGANTIDYGAARNRINDVSDVGARFINLLISNGLTNHGRVSIIGHSLGGHTAGLIGKKVTGGRVQTIIGLDPAGPLFNTNAPNERIASQDANYVEVIHTNGWTLGFGEPLGQADFFPNHGRSQPGCGVDLVGTCSHGRAPQFFAESVRDNRFVSNQCASFDEVNNGRCTVQSGGHMMGGEPPNAGKTGYFHVTTNANSPFGRG